MNKKIKDIFEKHGIDDPNLIDAMSEVLESLAYYSSFAKEIKKSLDKEDMHSSRSRGIR